ncbi:MAG: sigma-70 family RNA polymerase sigma factor [Verrucomicrobiales bacterium]|nr:sigma-70 family RNA polymerase sigma factor [Verrucomicrobiales bacterium]
MSETAKKVRPDRQEEYELMQRIAAGDAEAFAEFNQKYHVLIYTTIMKVLNHHEDTQDVMNEVLTTMWKKAENYHPGKGSLVTWICTTSRNRAIDRIRSVQRRSALYDRYEAKLEVDIPEKRSSGREDLYLSDARRILNSAVVTLSPEQREVIELAYFEGLTQRQIAERIDSPLGTVKARIRRGVEKLRCVFDDRFNDEGKVLLSSLS